MWGRRSGSRPGGEGRAWAGLVIGDTTLRAAGARLVFLKPFNLDHSPARADGEAASAVGGRGGPTEHSRPTDPQARGSLGPSWNKSCPSCMFLERPETGERPSAPYSRIPARVCCLTCKRRVKKDKTQPGWKSRVGLNESLWKLRAGPGRAGQLGAPSAEQGPSQVTVTVAAVPAALRVTASPRTQRTAQALPGQRHCRGPGTGGDGTPSRGAGAGTRCLGPALGSGQTAVRGPSSLRLRPCGTRPVRPPRSQELEPPRPSRSLCGRSRRSAAAGAPGGRPSLRKAPGSSHPAAAGAASVKDPVGGPASPPTRGGSHAGSLEGSVRSGLPARVRLPTCLSPEEPGAAPGPRH